MFKHYFEQVENIADGPVISLIIFFVFFVALIYWVMKVDKRYVDKMKNLPLEKEENSILE